MKNLKSMFTMASEPQLNAKLAALRARKDQIATEIKNAEETRRLAALGATDGDLEMQKMGDEARATISRGQRELEDIDTTIATIIGALAELEAKRTAEGRARAVDAHNRMLDDRTAIVKRIQSILEGLAPELRALSAISDKIRINHHELTRGTRHHQTLALTNYLSDAEIDRRFGDQLFQLGVSPSLGGARPLFLMNHSGRRYAELEIEAHNQYRLDANELRPATAKGEAGKKAKIAADFFDPNKLYQVEERPAGSNKWVATDEKGNGRELPPAALMFVR